VIKWYKGEILEEKGIRLLKFLSFIGRMVWRNRGREGKWVFSWLWFARIYYFIL